ncbi:hypothetical protein AN958_01556 [Leucoagaricus sp. SymC.cos]|nr:hypothetical protein AN958_01556 [Leucoagaricus sp. SymC.cos]
MSDLQPVVVSYLKVSQYVFSLPPIIAHIVSAKLPPDEEPFFRSKEILELFKEKLEQLTFALAATQGPNNSDPLPSEIVDLLKPLRRSTAEQCENVGVNMRFLQMFAEDSLQLVNASSTASAGQGVAALVQEVTKSAQLSAGNWRDAEKGMEQLSEEIVTTVEKITAVINKDRAATASIVFDERNSQAINDFIHATQDGSALFRNNAQFLQETADHFQDIDLQVQLPTEQEIAIMRERWSGFLEHLEPLKSRTFAAIATQIRSGPDLREAKARADFWKRHRMESSYERQQRVPKAFSNTGAQDTKTSGARRSTRKCPTMDWTTSIQYVNDLSASLLYLVLIFETAYLQDDA